MMQFQGFAGPIPPPALLGQYEQVCEGAANRILTQFEEQGRHRRDLERKAINYNVASATIGQVAGFLLFVVAIAAGTFLLYHDKQAGGLGTIITAVGGAAWVLVIAEKRKKKDLQEKRGEGKKGKSLE